MVVKGVTLPVESDGVSSSFDNVEDEGGGETLFFPFPPLLFFFLFILMIV